MLFTLKELWKRRAQVMLKMKNHFPSNYSKLSLIINQPLFQQRMNIQAVLYWYNALHLLSSFVSIRVASYSLYPRNTLLLFLLSWENTHMLVNGIIIPLWYWLKHSEYREKNANEYGLMLSRTIVEQFVILFQVK